MQNDNSKIEKLYYSMGEIAEMFNVNASTIRYWEKRFPNLKPKKNKKGNRLFTTKDIEDLKVIYHLLKVRKLTINGALTKLKDNKNDVADNQMIVEKLHNIKQKLIEVRNNL